jgi:hypothetical protein
VTACAGAGGDLNHQKRPTTLLGPRLGWFCTTCIRNRKTTKKALAKSKRLERIFGLTDAEVEAIRADMPKNRKGIPVCPGCLVATGASRALAVDHDHVKEAQGLPIRETVRGFLCSTCNQMIEKYGVAGLGRLIAYINDPPAQRVLAAMDRNP